MQPQHNGYTTREEHEKSGRRTVWPQHDTHITREEQEKNKRMTREGRQAHRVAAARRLHNKRRAREEQEKDGRRTVWPQHDACSTAVRAHQTLTTQSSAAVTRKWPQGSTATTYAACRWPRTVRWCRKRPAHHAMSTRLLSARRAGFLFLQRRDMITKRRSELHSIRDSSVTPNYLPQSERPHLSLIHI